MQHDQAEIIAIKALQHIASDENLLTRFIQLSGLSVENLRQSALEDHFLAAVLHFIRQNDSDCLNFAANNHLTGMEIEKAHMVLDKKES